MDLSVGKKMIYSFPTPKNVAKKCFVGIIDFIGETVVTLKDESNTVLKITSKNFHLLKPYTKSSFNRIDETRQLLLKS